MLTCHENSHIIAAFLKSSVTKSIKNEPAMLPIRIHLKYIIKNVNINVDTKMFILALFITVKCFYKKEEET